VSNQDQTVRYPGKVLKIGSKAAAAVAQVQRRLTERGCGLLEPTGRFDAATSRAVKQCQARFTDALGQPLTVDGVVGPVTWATLFGRDPEPSLPDPSLATAALGQAVNQIGVMEQPAGSNRGPVVDEYVRRVGLNPSGAYPWCAAFVYWCFSEAAKAAGSRNPVVKTAGVLDHWRKATDREIPRVTGAAAKSSPERVQPGFVFIMDFGGGVGHTGLVEKVLDGHIVTIEGNTNDGGSREGIGVFRRTGRKLASINKGFLDYRGV